MRLPSLLPRLGRWRSSQPTLKHTPSPVRQRQPAFRPRWVPIALGFLGAVSLHAKIVINEIFYHAPADLDSVQWIELANTGPEVADLGGWSLDRGVQFQFPAGAKLAPGSFVVICRDRESFERFYPGVPVAGVFKGKLKSGGERLELKDPSGRPIDGLHFDDRMPWPTSPDGQTASLERITASAPTDDPFNWAPSPLTSDPQRPGGTPGKQNSNHSASFPPAILGIDLNPTEPSPGQPVQVTVRVRPGAEAQQVTLWVSDARPGIQTKESKIPLTSSSTNQWSGSIPARQKPGILRVRAQAEGAGNARRFFPHPNDPQPTVSCFVHDPLAPSRIPQAYIIQTGPDRLSGEMNYNRSWNSPQKPPPPIHGTTALVWVSSNGAPAQVRDHVTVQERTAGWKIHLHKHQPLEGMTTLNFTFEDHERFVVAEPMAYALHRSSGVPAARTEFVRLTFDDRLLGYHLMIEQPNKAFLKQRGRPTDGHLYKLQWFGNGIMQQHEKKTRVAEGHGDLVQLVNQLSKSRGEAQWQVIKTNFNVEEVLGYFAVSSLTAYWDGFFNNYFTYHDVRSGRWELYPWDLDKAWGYHDMVGNGIFTELPLNYGAEGDVPPGWKGKPPRNFFEGGSPWWRPGGWFSKYLLANPTARNLYHSRLRELLDTEFTEEKMGAAIDHMREQLLDEVKIRANAIGDDPRRAERRFEGNLKLLRDFVKKRRAYLLAQPEIANARPFDRSLLQ